MRKTIATLAAAACMALALAAPAQAEFGFMEINSPGKPSAPAFPGDKAIWAGTCDLASADTSHGGVGVAPTERIHCMDPGADYLALELASTESPWKAGGEPSWRLDPVTQAGAHPDATAAFWFNYKDRNPDGQVKNIIVKLPPGVVGNPEAIAKCPAIEAQAVPPACRAESQAGVNTIGFPNRFIGPRGLRNYPVYNIEARDTITAEFLIGNIAGFVNVPITARGRTNGDYGVDTLALLVPSYAPFGGQLFTFWGVPWAASHTPYRINGEEMAGALAGLLWSSIETAPTRQPYDPEWGPIKPFFTNPTECTGKPLSLEVDVDSWLEPVYYGGSFKTGTVITDPITGCDNLNFDPNITLHPDVKVADSPSGLDVELSIPQNNDPPEEFGWTPANPDIAHNPADDTGAPAYWKTPAGLGTAHLKDTVVKLPKGTSFNPAAADGLQGCTTAQIGLTATVPKATFNNDPVQCPDSSKIGTLEIVSPLLPEPLFGAVYAAPQNDNPFPGTLTAIYLVSEDVERGLTVKLAGRVDLDPDTGQISTTFVDNPQLPFDHFRLHFETGPRAPLNTPATCGQFENAADLIPWSFPDSGPQPTIHDPFPISAMPNGLACVDQPEDRTFKPGFVAGTTSNKAVSYTNFALRVTRNDGEQEISGVNLDMPPGLTGDLSKTPYCPEAAIAAARVKTGEEETEGASCPAASYIGKVDTLAGPGATPLHTEGKLYLSGPYDADGAGPKPQSPLSVTTVVPAIAGGTTGNPAFDLGNVVIRTGINLDSQTAQVHIDSTDVPYIVGGVPLRIRKVSVNLDKPGFMLTGTNCDALSVGGGIRGAADPLDKSDDVLASVSTPFQLKGCGGLQFKPALTLKVKGGTKRNDYQQLTATLTPRPGDANLKSISVALPHSEFLAQNHINTVCTRVQFAAKACPEGSVYGFAKATTPLLKDPLEGPVYLRSSNNPLPDMVLGLRGQVDLDVVGRVDSVNGGLRNSFEVTPDAPVTQFTLTLKGAKKSLLVNSRDICFKTKVTTKRVNGKLIKTRKRIPTTPKATVNYVAQNGIELTQMVPLQSAGCAKKSAAKAKRKG